MSSKTRPPIYDAIGTIAAIIIGIDCAINAWYYLFLMGGIFANPAVIILCASAGFLLNTLLYKQDFPAACEKLVNTVCSWFVAKTYSTLSLSSLITQIGQEIIALSSAIATGLFTYHSYVSLAIPHITLPWIVMLSVASVIGVYGLVREACDFNKMATRVSTVWKQWSSRPWKISLLFIFCALLLTTYVAGTVWTLETITAGATAAVAPLLPIFSTYMPYIGAFFLIGECIFITDSITETLETFGGDNPPLNTTLVILLTLALANGIGNAAITTADSGLLYKAIIGGILSFGVMMQTSFGYAKKEAEQASSTPWWTAANQLSFVVMGVLILAWGYMEWIAPIIPLPPFATLSILLTSSLAIAYLAAPPRQDLFTVTQETSPEMPVKKNHLNNTTSETPKSEGVFSCISPTKRTTP